MNDCLHQYTTQKDYDALKMEYITVRRAALLANPAPQKPIVPSH